MRNGFDFGNNNAVSSLFSNLCIRHNHFESIRIALQAQHFSWRKSPFSVYSNIIIRAVSAQSARKRMYAKITAFIFMQYNWASDDFFILLLQFSLKFFTKVFAQKMFFI